MKGMTKIIIRGHLDKHWKDFFQGIDLTYEGDNTIFTGNIKDESYLHGILNRIRDFNLKLVSVNPVDDKNDFNN